MIRGYEKTVIVYLKCIMLFCALYICVYNNTYGQDTLYGYAVKENVVLQFSKEGYKILKYKIKKLPDTVQLKYDKKVELK